MDLDQALHEVVVSLASVATRLGTAFAAANLVEREGPMTHDRQVDLEEETVIRPHSVWQTAEVSMGPKVRWGRTMTVWTSHPDNGFRRPWSAGLTCRPV